MTNASVPGEMLFRALLLALPPEERLLMAGRMFDAAKVLALAGRPGGGVDSAAARRRHLFLRFYGGDFAPDQRDRILASLIETPSDSRLDAGRSQQAQP